MAQRNEQPRIRQGRTIAYLRVSTADQDTEKNKSDILRFTNDISLKDPRSFPTRM